MPSKKNVYLIGFMGSGKSYSGKRLAAHLGYAFYDLDAYLEEQEGKTITEIFAEEGEERFRELERQYLRALSEKEQTLIATGGGTPCFYDNMEWMNHQGITIYLKTPTDLLVQRLQSEQAHRPLLAEKTKEELTLFIQNKLAERSRFYEKASVLFAQEEENQGKVAELIYHDFQQITGH